MVDTMQFSLLIVRVQIPIKILVSFDTNALRKGNFFFLVTMVEIEGS